MSASIARVHDDVNTICADSASLDAAWKQLDANRSASVSMSEWMLWVKSRWQFISSSVANQAYRRTLASALCSPPSLGSNHIPDTLMRPLFSRILQTLPVCCEAEAMFIACDADGDHRVTISELKQHARRHKLKLNTDQMNEAVKLFEKGAGFSSFCDWYLQQRGGDTAEEIAAVR